MRAGEQTAKTHSQEPVGPGFQSQPPLAHLVTLSKHPDTLSLFILLHHSTHVLGALVGMLPG